MDIKKLVAELKHANIEYRKGNPIMPDYVYDQKVEILKDLDPNNKFFDEVGFIDDNDPRKVKLPIHLASMNKIKTVAELQHWVDMKHISLNEEVVLTPKLDGLSFCVEETKNSMATSRGDGIHGQLSTEHYKKLSNKSTNNLAKSLGTKNTLYSYGEVVMSKKVFANKYDVDFANPRNLVAGQINSKTPTEILKDCTYIKYGLVGYDFVTKSDLLDFLNANQKVQIEYIKTTIKDIIKSGEDYLKSVFDKWKVDYEIDGLVIEINNLKTAHALGRETSTNNPVWARAYKGAFEEVKDTEVLGIEWNISKQGYLKPIIKVKPIKLDGVTVSNVTGNNAKYIIDMGISTGSTVRLKRSGMVIPFIISVVKSKGYEVPTNCTSCNHNLVWNENEIELVCKNNNCEGQILKRIISFFDILDVKNVGEGVCLQLFNNGYNTIHKICSMSKEQMFKLDGFGKRKSEIVFNAIHSKLSGVQLSKLQHATGFFGMLGSKKLLLLEDLSNRYLLTNNLPLSNEIIERDGFSEISSDDYLTGLPKFKQFIESLTFTLEAKKEIKKVSNDLDGKSFVFTGVRSAELEEIIKSKGGKIGSGVSKTTTHLIVKVVGSGSAKETKAIELGCKIMTLEELKNSLN